MKTKRRVLSLFQDYFRIPLLILKFLQTLPFPWQLLDQTDQNVPKGLISRKCKDWSGYIRKEFVTFSILPRYGNEANIRGINHLMNVPSFTYINYTTLLLQWFENCLFSRLFPHKIVPFKIQCAFLASHYGLNVNFPSNINFELLRIKMIPI